MSQGLLYRLYINTAFQGQGCKCMPQAVESNVQSRFFNCSLKYPGKRPGVKRFAQFVSKNKIKVFSVSASGHKPVNILPILMFFQHLHHHKGKVNYPVRKLCLRLLKYSPLPLILTSPWLTVSWPASKSIFQIGQVALPPHAGIQADKKRQSV